MGLPLIQFVIADLPGAKLLETAVLIALPPVVILYNVGSVAVLSIYSHDDASTAVSWKTVLVKTITNPLLLACLLGVAFKWTEIPFPVSIYRTCEVVGSSAFPIALLGIGSQLIECSFRHQLSYSVLATVLKCVFCPAVAWLISQLLGLDGAARQVVLILSAVPTAVSSYVLADQLDADSEFAASSVVFCTACSLITLTVLLWLTT